MPAEIIHPPVQAPAGPVVKPLINLINRPPIVLETPTVDPASPIGVKWTQAGGAGVVGDPTRNVQNLPYGDGLYQTFTHGVIFYSTTYGAVLLSMAIFEKWQTLTSQTTADGSIVQDYIGVPIADYFSIKAGGDGQYFERGMIVARQDGHSYAVIGEIYGHYRDLGDVTSFLGLPTSDEQSAVNGGRVSQFDSGCIHWSMATGAREVHGDILKRWLAIGGAGGVMGYPTSDESAVMNKGQEVGRFNTFANGGAIYWTGNTGAWDVYGDIAACWKNNYGGPGGVLGFPTSGETDTPDAGGRYNNFQSGVIVWHASGPYAGAWGVTGLRLFIDHFESDWGKYHVETIVQTTNATAIPGARVDNWYPSSSDYASNPSVQNNALTIPIVNSGLSINVHMEAYGEHTLGIGADERLGAFQGVYDITNLWGLLDQTNPHPANQNLDAGHHFNCFFSMEGLSALAAGVSPRQQLWWPFHNFSNPQLTDAQYAQTFTDIHEDESWIFHPFDKAFYELVYKGISSSGNCFGMCLESIYARVNRSLFPEPIFNNPFLQYSQNLQQGQDPVSPTDDKFIDPINIKHGYQVGASVLDYWLGKFITGKTHDPVNAFNESWAQFKAGDFPLISMTKESLGGGGHVVVPYAWDNTSSPWTIKVFNPNAPYAQQNSDTAEECVIVIDPKANTFKFVVGFDGQGRTDPDIYTGCSSSGGRMVSLPFSIMNSEPRTPFWEALALLVAGTLIICGDNGQTAQVTDGAGRTFYQYTEIPGGAVAGPLHIAAALHSIKDLQADSQRIPNMALIPQWTDPVVPGCGELYYLQRPQTFSKAALPAAVDAAANEVQLKWEVASTPGSSYTWAMRSPAGAAIVVAPGSAVSDLVHIDNISRPGQAISMATSSGGAPKSVTITLVGPNSGGSNAGPRIFELTNVPIGAQPSLIVQHDNGGQELVIQNAGDPAVIGLRIQSGSNAANSATRPAVTIGAGAVVKLFPGDWAPGKIATAAVTAHYLDKVGGSVIKQALL